jgi:hypothetical protein
MGSGFELRQVNKSTPFPVPSHTGQDRDLILPYAYPPDALMARCTSPSTTNKVSLQLIAGAQISQLHRVSVDPSDGLIGDAEPLDQV